MNTFGRIFRLTTFGESHGPAIGGIIDGMPAGVNIDVDFIQRQLDRRRPGQSALVTQRREADTIKILSGVFNGISLGTPIGFMVENTDQRSTDYSDIEHTYRPGHADFTYDAKYGRRDYRGGGRASARETLSRVVGGAFALMALNTMGIAIYAYTSRIGQVSLPADFRLDKPEDIESNPVRCPDTATANLMMAEIEDCKHSSDSVGGTVDCVITGCPAGLGEPVFGKLQARLAAAMMSINAAKGFEYGMGFRGAACRGSEVVDSFTADDNGRISTTQNHSGGIQGGISNGMPIYMRVAFKPTATMTRELPTVDDSGCPTVLKVRGRHDPCVVPRAVPVVEAMAAITILDAILQNRSSRI